MQKTKVILCTSSEDRHKYVASELSRFDIDLLVLHEKKITYYLPHHLQQRQKIEHNTFGGLIHSDYHYVYIEEGEINKSSCSKIIKNFSPDYFVSYGCSIIKDHILDNIKCPKINIHLGLSPYYRGTATNFWPIYNQQVKYCGVTFHELSNIIDGGKIFHQFQIEKFAYKTVHELGNSLIKRIPTELMHVIRSNLKGVTQSDSIFNELPRFYYKNSDFSQNIADQVNEKFEQIMEEFLNTDSHIALKVLP